MDNLRYKSKIVGTVSEYDPTVTIDGITIERCGTSSDSPEYTEISVFKGEGLSTCPNSVSAIYRLEGRNACWHLRIEEQVPTIDQCENFCAVNEKCKTFDWAPSKSFCVNNLTVCGLQFMVRSNPLLCLFSSLASYGHTFLLQVHHLVGDAVFATSQVPRNSTQTEKPGADLIQIRTTIRTW